MDITVSANYLDERAVIKIRPKKVRADFTVPRFWMDQRLNYYLNFSDLENIDQNFSTLLLMPQK